MVLLLPSSLLILAATTVLAAKKVAVLATDNADDSTGKTLYITEPACGYYQCVVTWPVGSSVAVNWLGPPAGNVSVSLESNVGGPTYPIIDSIAATSQEGYCDAGYGLGVVAPGHECGRVEFVIPSGWTKMDNYTIVVQSLSDDSLVGYTDRITIAAANASLTVNDPPSGTIALVEVIADPTSTDTDASTKYTGTVPKATAVTGAANVATAAATSAAATSSTIVKTKVASSSTASSTASSAASVSSAASLAVKSSGTASSSSSASSSSAAASASQTGAAPAGALVAKTAAALGGVAALVVLAL